MKLITSNPTIHANTAAYKAMVYKLVLPVDITQPPTLELYQRGVSVSQYLPNFGNGVPTSFYSDVHAIQIDWEIEGLADACYFGVIYSRTWEPSSPVVFTEMYYNSREDRQVKRELCLLRADGLISPENAPVAPPQTHVFVNENGYVYSSTTPWEYINNPVTIIEDQPVDTFLRIRILVGHYNLYTNLAVHHVGSNQSSTFFVPDNYNSSGGCGCNGGGGTIDLTQIMNRFDNLDAAMYDVQQKTNKIATVETGISNLEYQNNELSDKVMQSAMMLGSKVDLVGSKVDTQATAVSQKVDAVGLQVTAADGKVVALDTKVTAQATTLGQKVDAANASITSVDSKISSEAALTRTAVTTESTAIKGKIDAIDMSSAGVPQNVIDMIMDLHAEALGSWTWDKRSGILKMYDTHGLEAAAFSVKDNADLASRERRTDLEVS